MYVMLKDRVAAANAILHLHLGFGVVRDRDVAHSLARIVDILVASDLFADKTKERLRLVGRDFLYKAYGEMWVETCLWKSDAPMPLAVWHQLAARPDPMCSFYAAIATHGIRCNIQESGI